MNPLKAWYTFRLSCLITIAWGFLFFCFTSTTLFAATVDLPSPNDVNIVFKPTPDNDPNAAGTGTNPGTRAWAAGMEQIVTVIMALAGVIALTFLIWSAIKITTAGDNEESLSEGKNGVIWGLLGLTLLLTITPIIRNVLFPGDGTQMDSPADQERSIRSGIDLLLEALTWFEAILIIVAVGYIIFAGVQMVTALGDTDQLAKSRSTLLVVGAGIVIIILNDIFIEQVLYPWALGDDYTVEFEPDAAKGVEQIASVITYFLQFLAVVAFGAIIYGGALMVGSFGNDERVESGKKILTGAAIGIVVILISFTLVSTFLAAQVT